jgi:hypothetical protein
MKERWRVYFLLNLRRPFVIILFRKGVTCWLRRSLGCYLLELEVTSYYLKVSREKGPRELLR